MGLYLVSTDYWIRKLQVTNAYWEFKKCMQAKINANEELVAA